MKINLFGQRNILGCGVHFSSFSDALKRYSIISKMHVIQEWDFTNQEMLEQASRQTNDEDINIWFPGPNESAQFKGKNIVWAIFESDALSRHYLEPLFRADLIWTPSQWGKKILVSHGLSPDKIDVVPEGVDPCIFHPFARRAIDDHAYHFLVIGKYEQRKGYDQLLEAFSKAFRQTPNVQLLIKGDLFTNFVEVGNELKSRIDDMGMDNIKIISGAIDVDSLAALYNYADGFVLPSRSEGWGLPLTEAIACGLPVATLRYSGPTEYLSQIENLYLPIAYDIIPIADPVYRNIWPSDGGLHGNWAQANADDLAQQMQDMVENRSIWNERALQASEIMRTRFNWSKAIDAALKSLLRAKFLPQPVFYIATS